MSIFVTIVKMDFSRFLEIKRLTTILLIILVIALCTVSGINDTKKSLTAADDFAKLESGKFKELKTYKQYSIHGVTFYYVSDPLFKFMKPAGSTAEPVGGFNNAAVLHIKQPIMGAAALLENASSPYRPAYILYILGMLFALFLGGETTRDKDYLKYLACLLGPQKTYWFAAAARIIVVSLILLVIFLTVPIVCFFKGYLFSLNSIAMMGAYFLTLWMSLVFALCTGMVIGSLCNKENITVPLLTTWLVTAILVPGIIDTCAGMAAKNITSSYKVDAEKLAIFNNYKKKVYRELGKFSRENKARYEKRAVAFMNNEYRQMEKLENNLRKECADSIALKKSLTRLTPMSFFLDTGNEISSLGPDNFIEFYRWLQKQKLEFLNFHIDKVFHRATKTPVPFNHSHIFFAQSRLPRHFAGGVLFNLFLIIAAVNLGFWAYKRGMFPPPAKGVSTAKLGLYFAPGAHMTYKVYPETFIQEVLNVFFGKSKNFNGHMALGDEDIVTGKQEDFLLLPAPDQVPGEYKVITFLKQRKVLSGSSGEEFREAVAELDPVLLNRRFKNLERQKKVLVILLSARMKKCSVYIMQDIAAGVGEEFLDPLRRYTRDLRNKGAVIIDFVTKPNNTWHDGEDSISSIHEDGGEYVENEIM